MSQCRTYSCEGLTGVLDELEIKRECESSACRRFYCYVQSDWLLYWTVIWRSACGVHSLDIKHAASGWIWVKFFSMIGFATPCIAVYVLGYVLMLKNALTPRADRRESACVMVRAINGSIVFTLHTATSLYIRNIQHQMHLLNINCYKFIYPHPPGRLGLVGR
jgi:hypothetical protein